MVVVVEGAGVVVVVVVVVVASLYSASFLYKKKNPICYSWYTTRYKNTEVLRIINELYAGCVCTMTSTCDLPYVVFGGIITVYLGHELANECFLIESRVIGAQEVESGAE